MEPIPQKTLVIRSDKLGDFMLAYPVFHYLKTAVPVAIVDALVTEYTKEMAETNPYINKIIIDPGKNAPMKEQLRLLKHISREKYDAVITLFSTTRIGFLITLARIPYRLAPATKVAQIFYNHRLVQRRSLSKKPEYEYNLDLAKRFLSDFRLTIEPSVVPPYLEFPQNDITKLKIDFCHLHGINLKHQLVFVHPGSGGSAVNLTLQQFSDLGSSLKSSDGLTIVITAGPNEKPNAEKLASLLSEIPRVVYHSTEGLRRFAEHIQFADIFISGSTGPLHIAGALNRPTVAFYPRRRSATALRWQTLNSPERRLAFSPDEQFADENLAMIDMAIVAKKINEQFLI